MGWFSWLPGMSEKKEEKPPEPLVLGATLSCIYGSQASYLDLDTKGFDINGLPEACVEDCVVVKNISPFGKCHVGDMCEYQIAIDGIWQNPEPQKVLKNGKEIITTKSILKCKEASEPFTIKNSGQDGVHAKDLLLIHYMEDKHKDLYKILQDQYGSLYLQGNYEEAIEFLEERLVDNNGEMEIINMYAPDNTEGKLVLATLEKLLVDCKTKAFEDFMEALEHTATENEMTNFSGWDKNYLNLTMIELIKQDCKKTAERIDNDPAYRAMEKHKVFSSWGAESMNTIAYTTVLTASAMAGMNTGKGKTSQESSNQKSTTQKSTDPKSTTQKSTIPAKVKDSKNVSTEGTGSKLDEIEVKFKRNINHNSEEFTRQLKAQEEGMNKLTVDEYLGNRGKYLAEGRSAQGNAAQQVARENAYLEKVRELRVNGLSEEAANISAKKWMDTQAALHNPDQIAGGNPFNIGGMGDKNINSSIGAQWKYRINAVDEQIQNATKGMTNAERASTYINVRLKE